MTSSLTKATLLLAFTALSCGGLPEGTTGPITGDDFGDAGVDLASSSTSTQTALPAVCNAAPLSSDVVLPDLASPARGSVTGSEVVARLCDGGASAYMQRTSPTTSPPNQLEMIIGSYSADPKLDYNIALPTGATQLQLTVVIGPSAAQAGTYTESNACGFITLCASMPPIPTSVDCTIKTDVCPPGCVRGASGCVPVEPATCWQANTNPYCSGYGGPAIHAEGSWRLTLSSVEPYTGSGIDTSGYELFVTHGSLDATLVKVDTGSGATPASNASLSLTF
jgi:hypothetical protein